MTKKPKAESFPVEKKPLIRIPEIGDVVSPDGAILVSKTTSVRCGMIMIDYRKGLMAMLYGWRVVGANEVALMIERKY